MWQVLSCSCLRAAWGLAQEPGSTLTSLLPEPPSEAAKRLGGAGARQVLSQCWPVHCSRVKRVHSQGERRGFQAAYPRPPTLSSGQWAIPSPPVTSPANSF